MLSTIARGKYAAPLLVICGLSFIATPPAVTLVPLVLLMASLLHLMSSVTIRATPSFWPSISLAFVALVLGSSISRGNTSIQALSSVGESIIAQVVFSSVITAISLIPFLVYNPFFRKNKYVGSVSTFFAFPALWVTGNILVSKLSPVGRLGIWSPVQGIEGYRWMVPYVGAAGQDWIVGLWAVLLSGIYRLVSPPQEPIPERNESNIENNSERIPSNHLVEYEGVQSPGSTSLSNGPSQAIISREPSKILLSLTVLALALALPSFFLPPGTTGASLPLLSDAFSASPHSVNLALAFILPTEPNLDSPKVPTNSFDSYFAESKRYSARATILLWPEGAVRFESQNEREERFTMVQTLAQQHEIWIGVGFEDRDPDSGGGDPTRGKRRNGLVVIGPKGIELEYYKNHLVPISESHSIVPSTTPPTLATIHIPYGRKTAHGRPHYPLSITASICLDLAHPGNLLSLPSQPQIILAPGSVWTTEMSQAIFEQARMRADEVGSLLMWCDRAPEGVSGVVGQGESGGQQVGRGTFIKHVSIPLRVSEEGGIVIPRTFYAWGGDILVLVLVWILFGLEIGIQRGVPGIPTEYIRDLGSSTLENTRNSLQSIGGSIRHRYHLLLDRVRPSRNDASATREAIPNLLD